MSVFALFPPGEVFGLQSCQRAGSVFHALCRPPYRLYQEQPPYCKVTHHCITPDAEDDSSSAPFPAFYQGVFKEIHRNSVSDSFIT